MKASIQKIEKEMRKHKNDLELAKNAEDKV